MTEAFRPRAERINRRAEELREARSADKPFSAQATLTADGWSEWMLPSGKHRFTVTHDERKVYWSVSLNYPAKLMQSGSFEKDRRWEGLLELAWDLACKRYSSKQAADLLAWQRSYRK